MFGSFVFPYAMVVDAPIQSLMVSWWEVVSLSVFILFLISQQTICHSVLWYASDPPVRLFTSFHHCALMCIRVTASDVGSCKTAETWPLAASTYAMLWCFIARFMVGLSRDKPGVKLLWALIDTLLSMEYRRGLPAVPCILPSSVGLPALW